MAVTVLPRSSPSHPVYPPQKGFFLHLELGTYLLHEHHKTPAPMLPLHVTDQKSKGERVKCPFLRLMYPMKDMRLDLAPNKLVAPLPLNRLLNPQPILLHP